MKPESKTHFAIIDGLRAIAALSVCWYHITGFFKTDPTLSLLTATGRYGFTGIDVFFVISGFVIPYALHRGGYRLSMMGWFVAKRVTRIDPPYLTAIGMVLAWQLAVSHTSLHQGAPYSISWKQVLAHLGYINAFIGLPWLLESFWTLAIEFQYYLTMGLLFPLIARPGFATTIAIGALSGVLSLLLPSIAHLPHYLPLFAMGIAIFRRLSLNDPPKQTATLLVAGAAFSWLTLGWLAALLGLLTALTILLVRYTNRVLGFFGEISYSLYLIHPFIAGIVVIQGGKFLGSGRPARIFLVFAAVAASIATAWMLYHAVELPSKKLSAGLRYRHSRHTEPKVLRAPSGAIIQ